MIYVALVLFAVTYILMLMCGKYRPYIALGSALLFILGGMLPLHSVLDAIDFNVLLMIAGTMGTVALFIESKMPELLADLIMEKVPNVKWFCYIWSAVVNHDSFWIFYFSTSKTTCIRLHIIHIFC